MLDEDAETKEQMIWSRVASGVDGVIQTPLKGSIVGDCIQSGEIVNIHDAYEDKRFDSKVDQKTGFKTKAVLAVPVKDDDGKVIGAIQMINKKDPNNIDSHADYFGEGDIRCVKMLASHVSCFIRVVNAG